MWCDDEQGRACTLASARDLARIDARISSAEVSGKQNLDDLRRERVAISNVIEGFGNLQRESALFGILRFGIICVSKKGEKK